MGIDDKSSYFIRKKIACSDRIFFLGYPTITNFGGNELPFLLRDWEWESCDISQNKKNNTRCSISDYPIDKKFDIIIDHGTLQHIIDPLNAILKLHQLTHCDSSVLHFIPYNGHPGFGYYQFSPEIFSTLEDLELIKDLKFLIYDENNHKYFFMIDKKIKKFRFVFGRQLMLHVEYKVNHEIQDDKRSIDLIRRHFQEKMFSSEQVDYLNLSLGRCFNSTKIIRSTLIDILDLVVYRVVQKPLKFRADNLNVTACRYDNC